MRVPLILVCALAVAAQSLPQDRQQEIERLISQEMSRQTIPGLSVAMAAAGEVVWTGGFGMSDIENNVPTKASTQYRTGSVAKPITSVAIMQLVEAHKMDLDAEIHRYVPTFPRKPWAITIRQLLGHLGGIRHYGPEETNVTAHYRELAPALRLFQNDSLVAEPGTRYHYTTYGYVLLGAALEHAAGMRYMDYLRQKVLRPAAMDRTRDDHVYAIIPNRARGYALSAGGQLQNCSLADTSYKIPGGGLISTSEDLVRFGLAVRAGALCGRQSLEAMFTSQKTRDGKSTGYGLGWAVGTLDGRRIVRHTGGQQGVSAILAMLPKEGVVVAIMTNLEKAQLVDLSQRLIRLLAAMRFPQDPRTGRPPGTPALTPASARPIL